MTGINSIKEQFNDLKSERSSIVRNIESTAQKIKKLEEIYEGALEARVAIQTAAKMTQQNIEYHISSLVSMALSTINPDWPRFVARFVERRNKTECDLLFEEEGEEYKPFDGSGGGAINIADLALRFTYFSLAPEDKKNRASFVLDEPLRDLSPGLQSKASVLLKQIIDELEIQIVMISHQDDINISADRTFFVKKTNRISRVEVL